MFNRDSIDLADSYSQLEQQLSRIRVQLSERSEESAAAIDEPRGTAHESLDTVSQLESSSAQSLVADSQSLGPSSLGGQFENAPSSNVEPRIADSSGGTANSWQPILSKLDAFLQNNALSIANPYQGSMVPDLLARSYPSLGLSSDHSAPVDVVSPRRALSPKMVAPHSDMTTHVSHADADVVRRHEEFESSLSHVRFDVPRDTTTHAVSKIEHGNASANRVDMSPVSQRDEDSAAQSPSKAQAFFVPFQSEHESASPMYVVHPFLDLSQLVY